MPAAEAFDRYELLLNALSRPASRTVKAVNTRISSGAMAIQFMSSKLMVAVNGAHGFKGWFQEPGRLQPVL